VTDLTSHALPASNTMPLLDASAGMARPFGDGLDNDADGATDDPADTDCATDGTEAPA
jgi:hypothetical protein